MHALYSGGTCSAACWLCNVCPRWVRYGGISACVSLFVSVCGSILLYLYVQCFHDQICISAHFRKWFFFYVQWQKVTLNIHHQPPIIAIATVRDDKHAAFHAWPIWLTGCLHPPIMAVLIIPHIPGRHGHYSGWIADELTPRWTHQWTLSVCATHEQPENRSQKCKLCCNNLNITKNSSNEKKTKNNEVISCHKSAKWTITCLFFHIHSTPLHLSSMFTPPPVLLPLFHPPLPPPFSPFPQSAL